MSVQGVVFVGEKYSRTCLEAALVCRCRLLQDAPNHVVVVVEMNDGQMLYSAEVYHLLVQSALRRWGHCFDLVL